VNAIDPAALARLVVLVVLAACAPAPRQDPLPEVEPSAPRIVDHALTCDPASATWSAVAITDAWTGSGRLWWSADGDYRERHTLPSVSAARDGSDDRLLLELAIVPDWRDAAPNTRTWFNCETPGLAAVLQVLARDGRTVSDCVALGDSPERWGTWDPEVACVTPDTGDTSGSSEDG
jgi:hypothetical protein